MRVLGDMVAADRPPAAVIARAHSPGTAMPTLGGPSGTEMGTLVGILCCPELAPLLLSRAAYPLGPQCGRAHWV